jgi:hypothetical protein
LLTTIGDVLFLWVLAVATVAAGAAVMLLVLGVVAAIATVLGRLWSAVVARRARPAPRERASAAGR